MISRAIPRKCSPLGQIRREQKSLVLFYLFTLWVLPMLSCTLHKIRSLIETFPKPQTLWLVAMKLQLWAPNFHDLRYSEYIYEEEVSRSSWRWHCRNSLGKSSGCQGAEVSAAQLERVRIPNKNHIGKRVFDDRISLTRVYGAELFFTSIWATLHPFCVLDARKNISVFPQLVKLKSTPFILFFYIRKKIR